MRRYNVLVSVALLVVVACGGAGTTDSESPAATTTGSPTATAAPAPAETTEPPTTEGGQISLDEPCTFIDDATMTDLLGNPVVGEEEGTGLCNYVATDLAVGRVSMDVFVQDVAAVGCDLILGMFGLDDDEQVEGLGSSAAWKAAAETGLDQSRLAICLDEQFVVVLHLFDPDATLDRLSVATTVAGLVIDGLGT